MSSLQNYNSLPYRYLSLIEFRCIQSFLGINILTQFCFSDVTILVLYFHLEPILAWKHNQHPRPKANVG